MALIYVLFLKTCFLSSEQSWNGLSCMGSQGTPFWRWANSSWPLLSGELGIALLNLWALDLWGSYAHQHRSSCILSPEMNQHSGCCNPPDSPLTRHYVILILLMRNWDLGEWGNLLAPFHRGQGKTKTKKLCPPAIEQIAPFALKKSVMERDVALG